MKLSRALFYVAFVKFIATQPYAKKAFVLHFRSFDFILRSSFWKHSHSSLSLSLTVWVCLLCVRLKNGGNALKCFSWARASAFSSTSASGASLYFCSAILFFTWVWASFLVLFMYFIHFPLWVLIISPCYLKILDF